MYYLTVSQPIGPYLQARPNRPMSQTDRKPLFGLWLSWPPSAPCDSVVGVPMELLPSVNHSDAADANVHSIYGSCGMGEQPGLVSWSGSSERGQESSRAPALSGLGTLVPAIFP